MTHFINRPRARQIMAQAGLDAILVSRPLNVYYATTKTLAIERFFEPLVSAAIIPADPTRPVALIASAFDLYFGGSDNGVPEDVTLYPVSSQAEPPLFRVAGVEALPMRETRRRAVFGGGLPIHPDYPTALSRALSDLGMARARLGHDSAAAAELLAQAAPLATLRRAGDLMLHIRAIKTPAELALMRQASCATLDAVTIGARAVRETGSLRGLRQSIFAELTRRGLIPVHGNVDGAVDELYDEALLEGQALMLDFIGHLGFYQSDIGRTLFIGEPPPSARRAAEAIQTVWGELRPRIRPGLSFGDLHEQAGGLLRQLAPDLEAAFTSHLVGLQHWDQPRESVDGGKLDVMLEPGMVLSFDCPLLVTGIGGSMHMEDLLLITADGSEALHPMGEHIIVA